MNEPGTGEVVPELWKTIHEEIIIAIRATGATNIIVLDEHGFGQASGFSGGVQNSGILTYGQYFTQKYTNIAFSLHLYSTWIYGTQRLKNYFQAAKYRNLAVHVGEYGAAETYGKSIAVDLFKIVISDKIGQIVWHWDGSDIHDLTLATTQGGGFEINRTNGTIPTNLSFVGNLIWKTNYGQTFTDTDFEIKAPWMWNGSFESDLDEWFNWGGASVETANAVKGQKNVRIASGNSGGCGQPIYLLPSQTYVLVATARNSAVPAQATDLGVQFKNASGQTIYAVVNFTETTHTQKRVEFTTPAQLSDASVFMWKNDRNVAFFADDIQLFLKKDEVITGLVEPLGIEVRIAPNPTKGTVGISFLQPENIESLSLISTDGRILKTEKIDQKLQSFTWQVGSHVGVNILEINLGGKVIQKKIVIQE